MKKNIVLFIWLIVCLSPIVGKVLNIGYFGSQSWIWITLPLWCTAILFILVFAFVYWQYKRPY